MKRSIAALLVLASVAACADAPKSADGNAWVYHDGSFNWPGDYSFNAVPDYRDKSAAPLSGQRAIKVELTGPWGGWQPYAQNWSFDSKPYSRLTFALKPTVAGQTWDIYFMKVGDIPIGEPVSVLKYGPKPVPGQWGVYSVPLADLGVLGTALYKFCIQDKTGRTTNVWFVDDVGFLP